MLEVQREIPNLIIANNQDQILTELNVYSWTEKYNECEDWVLKAKYHFQNYWAVEYLLRNDCKIYGYNKLKVYGTGEDCIDYFVYDKATLVSRKAKVTCAGEPQTIISIFAADSRTSLEIDELPEQVREIWKI